MKNFHKIAIFLLISLNLACVENKIPFEIWYSHTKAEILEQSNNKADSIVFVFNSDSTYRKEYSFSNNHLFLLQGYNKNILALEIFYSKNGDFELRREMHENGNYAFEGITYKLNFYGHSTWFHPNGLIELQGVRYNNQHIGIWKEFDEKGNLISKINYGNIVDVESMPTIFE